MCQKTGTTLREKWWAPTRKGNTEGKETGNCIPESGKVLAQATQRQKANQTVHELMGSN